MNVAEFVDQLSAWASWASPKTGVNAHVILAQWADETGWGTSEAWVVGHNPAGISPGGQVAHYPTVLAGMEAYVETMGLHYYDGVRAVAANGAIAQAVALGESPWAGGHYGGAEHPGADLVAILERDFGVTVPAPPTHVPVPPVPPIGTPTWDEQAAAHPGYLAAVWTLSDAWYAIVNRHPQSAAEWHQIGTWAFEISTNKASMGAVIVEMSQLPGTAFKLRAA